MNASIKENPYFKALHNILRIANAFAFGCIISGGVVVGLFSLLGYLGSFNWLLDLTSQFRVQYVLYLSLCMLLCLTPRQRKMFVVWSLLLLSNLPDLAALYIPPTQTASAATGQPLRLLDMNLLYSNTDHQGAYRCIEKYNPDIITMQELTPEWYSFFDKSLAQYPYRKYWLRDNPFGIGIFSRIPIEQAEVVFPSADAPPVVRATLKKDGNLLNVLCVHTFPPTRAAYCAIDRKLTASIGAICTSLPGSVVLAGDLNATSSSFNFKSLIQQSRLKDSQRGFGWQPSWMTALPLPMRLSIDHCFVSKDIVVLKREIGPFFNSDHNPLYVELALPASKNVIGSALLK